MEFKSDDYNGDNNWSCKSYSIRKESTAEEYVSPHCISCKYLDEDKCTYFKRFRISEPKKIPWNIEYKGCKVYMPKKSKEHPLIDKVLDLFK